MIVLNLRALRNTLEQLKENENSDISYLRPSMRLIKSGVEETRVMISSVRELFQIIEEESDLTDK